MILRGFYFITDHVLTRQGVLRDVQSALTAGVAAIQYRKKDGDKDLMIAEAKEIRHLCQKVPFIVNDLLDVAEASQADGLHIGQRDISYAQARAALGREKIIGISVTSLDQAQRACDVGADYLGVGPIFATATKKDAALPCGTALIRSIKKICPLPIVAIGGITLENAAEVLEAGADSLCAISATVASASVQESIQLFNKAFERKDSR
ncbi:MAG TPA: thiamine phosphate synthase [Candidatus Omnitrophota bacterium]|nr:thiamine phosphate synthase [Candidatus Omnitrophota bacterium]HQL41319.1 thiamine phosphate synthase [Candidatus Omnitrophota bacterium]